MKLSGKCTVALLLVFCLSVGQFAALGAEETAQPYVLPGGAEEKFRNAKPVGANVSLWGSIDPPTLAQIYEQYGEMAGNQWATCINLYHESPANYNAVYAAMEILYHQGAITAEDTMSGNDKIRVFDNYPFLDTSESDKGAEEAAPAEQSFPDVPADAWYAEAVEAMKDSGIIMGCEDGLFHPEKLVTQGEFYTMILRAATYPGANVSGGRKGESDHWAAGVLYLANNGTGYYSNAVSYDENGDEVLAGHEDDPVSRAEAVTRITFLYWDNTGIEDNSSTKTIQAYMPGEPLAFDDIPDCEAIKSFLASDKWRDYCANYLFNYKQPSKTWGEGVTDCIAYAYNQGICKGVDEACTFDADGLLTRAEVAQLFSNAGITYRLNLLPGKRTGMSGLAYDLSSAENIVR